METVVGWRGVAVRVEGAEDVVADVLAQLPPFYTAPDSLPDPIATATLDRTGDQLVATLPDELSITGPAGEETCRAAASRIELLVADRLPEVSAVHAGVVAFDGRAVVLPGTSMSGKSTLVRALLAEGAEYLSDEFGLVWPDGTVSAYPRRMTMRTPTGSVRAMAERARAADAGPLPVAVLATLRYSPAGWAVETVSAATAVLHLVENGVSVRREPARAMTAFGALTERAVRIAGTRGDAAQAAAMLHDHL